MTIENHIEINENKITIKIIFIHWNYINIHYLKFIILIKKRFNLILINLINYAIDMFICEKNIIDLINDLINNILKIMH